ncbi:DUF2971 domain-containing protein [Bacillus sp. CMF12]|uniref:DUF2971 domain-containing protein n=1 Tax=Bacillus sp. CMF12 TaxID=2884834 RepID=UPI00207935B5|nr:DUF2971 domain-containing protein [Bacillus sp. CMF12]USK48858.1 DUF2971 domain-containing protein [Bacillus sp. CMF12]
MFNENINPNQYLYHYTSYSTAIEHILTNQTLRFSPYTRTNDPRESKKWAFGLTCPTVLPSNDEITSIQEEMNRTLKENTKVLCFAKDTPQYDDYYSSGIYGGRGFAHPRMWAQYAGNHKGICFMFDKFKLATRIAERFSLEGEVYHGEVSYGSWTPAHLLAFNSLNYDEIKAQGIETYARRHFIKYKKELFFEKMSDWKDECEYRWTLFLNKNTEYEDFHFEDALSSIIIGVDFPQAYEVVIEQYAKKFKVHVARMVWQNGTASVVPVYIPGNDEDHFKRVFK